MGIETIVSYIEKEKDLIFNDIMDNSWTKAQLDVKEQGDEMSDLGIEMINDDEVENL